MLLLFSHKLTDSQREDAKENWGVDEFVDLPKQLQELWSNIDPNLSSICNILQPVRDFIEEEANIGDIVLVQGDFGACCILANFAKERNLTAVYATTNRTVKEYTENNKNIKKSIFEHKRFRRYE